MPEERNTYTRGLPAKVFQCIAAASIRNLEIRPLVSGNGALREPRDIFSNVEHISGGYSGTGETETVTFKDVAAAAAAAETAAAA